MSTLNINTKRRRISIALLLCVLGLLQFGCNPGKSMGGKNVPAKDSLRYDTLYYSLKKIRVKDSLVYRIIDSLVAEKQGKITKNDTVPFFGTIVIKSNEGKTDFSFTLSNRHSSVSNNEFFIKNVNGGFSYKNIFFFVVIEKAAPHSGLYLESVDDTVRASVLKLLRGDIEVNYPWLWLRRVYFFENKGLTLKSSLFDRTGGDFHTQ